MKGLLLNNLYFYRKSYNVGGPVFLAAAIFFVNTTSYTAFSLFFFTCSFMLNIGSMLQAEKLTGWAVYENLLPVKKSRVILTKYISYIFVLLTRIFSIVPVIILIFFLIRPFPLEYIQRGIFFGAALALFTGAFVYPLYLIQKENDSSSLILNSIGCSVVAICVIWAILRVKEPLLPFTGIQTAQTSLIVSIITFFISCIISVKYCKGR